VRSASRVDRLGASAYGSTTEQRRGRSVATTAVFAEILIVGLQVEAWLALVLLSVFGTKWIDLDQISDFAALVTVLVLALAYVLGIVADRLTDTMLNRVERTRRKERFKNLPVKVSKMRMTVMHESDGMTRFLDYQRSRWRIARATVVNVGLTGLAAALYLAVGTEAERAWVFAPLACALVLIPTTYFAAARIHDAWIRRLVDAYDIVTTQPR
jgi:hypothetical protein